MPSVSLSDLFRSDGYAFGSFYVRGSGVFFKKGISLHYLYRTFERSVFADFFENQLKGRLKPARKNSGPRLTEASFAEAVWNKKEVFYLALEIDEIMQNSSPEEG